MGVKFKIKWYAFEMIEIEKELQNLITLLCLFFQCFLLA
jgi:hypothetical protein